jgi:hypothetical protein
MAKEYEERAEAIRRRAEPGRAPGQLHNPDAPFHGGNAGSSTAATVHCADLSAVSTVACHAIDIAHYPGAGRSSPRPSASKGGAAN